MGMILVFALVFAHQFEVILVKQYGKNHGKCGMFFNAIICLFAMFYFLISGKGTFSANKLIFVYGFVNSVMFAIGFYSTYIAYKIGSFGLTKLFSSFGVIIPVFYGIIFLNERATFVTYIALIMILVSLFLANYQKQEGNTQKITLKWAICVLITVVSNAAITIIGRMQFEIFGDTYENEFLIISFAGAAIYLFLLSLIIERDSLKTTIKHGLVYGAGAGIFNGINNLLTLMVYNYLPLSFISPVKTGLIMVMNFFVAVLVYKEKFKGRQIISVVVGAMAVVLMSLS